MTGRTRKQKASQRSQTDDESPAAPLGNGTIHKGSPGKKIAPDQPKENIFLFWPNIIGMVYLQLFIKTSIH